jgi:hypothetical protein
VRQILWVNQTLDRLVQRDARRDEDREHDREPGQLLAPKRTQKEGDPQRHRRQRIAEVMNQIGKERDRAGEHEDHDLHERHCA